MTTPERMVIAPSGAKPPWAVRLLRPGESPAPTPSRKPAEMTMKAMIAATLIDANQNSNSP